MDLAKLTETYASDIVALRKDEEAKRSQLDTWLETQAQAALGGGAVSELRDALATALMRHEASVHAARIAREDAAQQAASQRSNILGSYDEAFRASVSQANDSYNRAKDAARRTYDAELKRIEEAGEGGVEEDPAHPDPKSYAFYNQSKYREKAFQAYQAALADAKRVYDQAWDDARTSYQGSSHTSLMAELASSETALSTEAALVEASDRDYDRSTKNAKAAYYTALGRLAPDLLNEYYRRRTEIGTQAEAQREQLHVQFLKAKNNLVRG